MCQVVLSAVYMYMCQVVLSAVHVSGCVVCCVHVHVSGCVVCCIFNMIGGNVPLVVKSPVVLKIGSQNRHWLVRVHTCHARTLVTNA